MNFWCEVSCDLSSWNIMHFLKMKWVSSFIAEYLKICNLTKNLEPERSRHEFLNIQSIFNIKSIFVHSK